MKCKMLPKNMALQKRFSDNELVCEKVIGIFQIISNKVRFRILCLLTEDDFSVNSILEIIQCGKVSNISQQLKLLTLAGILEKRRDRQRVIYHLKDARIRGFIKYLQGQFMQEKPS